MKNKTLKDIEPDCISGRHLDIEDIKKEAIKWVKEWDNSFKKTDKVKDKNMRISLVAQTNIFNHFFNITEEDLK